MPRRSLAVGASRYFCFTSLEIVLGSPFRAHRYFIIDYLLLVSCFCASGPGDRPTSDGPAFGVDVGVTNLRLAFADSIDMIPEVWVCV